MAYEWGRDAVLIDALALVRLRRAGAHVDDATIWYGYQQSPGHAHEPFPPLDARIAPVLKSSR